MWVRTILCVFASLEGVESHKIAGRLGALTPLKLRRFSSPKLFSNSVSPGTHSYAHPLSAQEDSQKQEPLHPPPANEDLHSGPVLRLMQLIGDINRITRGVTDYIPAVKISPLSAAAEEISRISQYVTGITDEGTQAKHHRTSIAAQTGAKAARAGSGAAATAMARALDSLDSKLGAMEDALYLDLPRSKARSADASLALTPRAIRQTLEDSALRLAEAIHDVHAQDVQEKLISNATSRHHRLPPEQKTHGGDESWRDMSYCFTENEAEDHVADSRLSMREAAIRILSRNAPSLGDALKKASDSEIAGLCKRTAQSNGGVQATPGNYHLSEGSHATVIKDPIEYPPNHSKTNRAESSPRTETETETGTDHSPKTETENDSKTETESRISSAQESLESEDQRGSESDGRENVREKGVRESEGAAVKKEGTSEGSNSGGEETAEVSDKPATGTQASESTAAESTASKSTASKSIVSGSTASESTASESTASESTAAESTASESIASKSIASEPTVSESSTSESTASKSTDTVPESSASEKSSAVKSSLSGSSVLKSSASGSSSSESSASESSASESSASESSASESSASESSASESNASKSSAAKSSAGKSSASKSSASESSSSKPSASESSTSEVGASESRASGSSESKGSRLLGETTGSTFDGDNALNREGSGSRDTVDETETYKNTLKSSKVTADNTMPVSETYPSSQESPQAQGLQASEENAVTRDQRQEGEDGETKRAKMRTPDELKENVEDSANTEAEAENLSDIEDKEAGVDKESTGDHKTDPGNSDVIAPNSPHVDFKAFQDLKDKVSRLEAKEAGLEAKLNANKEVKESDLDGKLKTKEEAEGGGLEAKVKAKEVVTSPKQKESEKTAPEDTVIQRKSYDFNGHYPLP